MKFWSASAHAQAAKHEINCERVKAYFVVAPDLGLEVFGHLAFLLRNFLSLLEKVILTTRFPFLKLSLCRFHLPLLCLQLLAKSLDVIPLRSAPSRVIKLNDFRVLMRSQIVTIELVASAQAGASVYDRRVGGLQQSLAKFLNFLLVV